MISPSDSRSGSRVFKLNDPDLGEERVKISDLGHFDQNYEKKFFIFSFMKNRSPPWGQMFEKK